MKILIALTVFFATAAVGLWTAAIWVGNHQLQGRLAATGGVSVGIAFVIGFIASVYLDTE